MGGFVLWRGAVRGPVGAPAAQLSPGGGGRGPDSQPQRLQPRWQPSTPTAAACSRSKAARLYAGYAYAGAGFGESTSDMVFDGYTGVFENGAP